MSELNSEQKCIFLSGTSRESANKEILKALADELVERGHQVIIIVDGQKENLVDTASNPAVYTWPSKRPTKLCDGLFLVKLIKRYLPDCMIAQFGSVNMMTLIGWLCRVRHRIPWYETLSTQIDADSNLPRWKIKLLRFRKRMVFSCASSFITNSSAAKKDLSNTFSVNQNKIKVIHNNIKDPLIDHKELLNTKSNTNHLVCIGRFNYSKGQDILIKAVKKLKDIPNLTVEFVGSGLLLGDFRKLAEQFEVEHICKFTGSVPHQQVFSKFAAATASVVPSRSEAFGYVCIESLSVGTPVIGSNTGGIPEIIRDGKDGFLFEPEDVKGLAYAIRRLLLASGSEREIMRANTRQRFLDSFEQNKLIKESVDWLETIVDHK